MRKRRKLFILAVCALFFALLLIVLLRPDSEPSYKGRALSSWLLRYNFAWSQNERGEAREAVTQIGSNAVPSLLRSLRYTPPRWKKFSIGVFVKLQNLPLTRAIIPRSLTIDNSAFRAELAGLGFKLLGETAAPAFPQLVEFACDSAHPERSDLAIRTLINMRPLANAAVANVLSAAPPQARLQTLRYIVSIREIPLIRDLLPSLIKCLRQRDDATASAAAYIINELRSAEPEAALALLVEATKHPSPKVRAEALRCITAFASLTPSTVATFTPLLVDPDQSVRTETTNLFRFWAPETLPDAPTR